MSVEHDPVAVRHLQANLVMAVSFPRLGISLQASLFQIVGYRGLVAEVETLRREPYDFENPDHEEMLMKVRRNGLDYNTLL